MEKQIEFEYLRKRNIEPEKFTDRIIFKEKENDGICFPISEKSRNTRKDSRKDTGRSSVLEMTRSGMELFVTHLKGNGTLQLPKLWSDSKIPVIQYSRVSVL